MLVHLLKTCCIGIVYVSVIVLVARQLCANARPKSFQGPSFLNRKKSKLSISLAKDQLLHDIKVKLSSFKMDKDNLLASLKTLIGSTPATTCNTERVAMGTRELSIRVDVLLSALAAGSFAWMCLVRFKRYKTAQDIPNDFFRSQRTLNGYVAGIPDGDGIKFYHQPAGILCFGPKKPNLRRIDLRNNAITIRIAGIDAPEMGHFGQPEQPFAREAMQHLETKYLLKKCRIKLFRIDQYGRAVASVHFKPHWWSSWRDVGREMLELGLACVYRGQGAEYGGQRAEKRKRGMWSQKTCFLPGEYKRAVRDGKEIPVALEKKEKAVSLCDIQ